MKELTLFFEDLPVRKIFINGQWWISAVDTAKAIGYSNPGREATRIMTRNIERFQGYSTRCRLGCVENGIMKNRMVTVLNLKGVIAFCMLSDLPNAIPFQRWADSVLEKHIKEKIKRRQVYGELTDESVGTRNMETKQWKRHGAKGKDFSDLTKKEYEVVFGNSDIRKKDMSGEELLKLMISNATNALSLMEKKDTVGVDGIENQINKTAKMIEGIKKDA